MLQQKLIIIIRFDEKRHRTNLTFARFLPYFCGSGHGFEGAYLTQGDFGLIGDTKCVYVTVKSVSRHWFFKIIPPMQSGCPNIWSSTAHDCGSPFCPHRAVVQVCRPISVVSLFSSLKTHRMIQMEDNDK
jgi:hypothetical protein